MADAGLARLRGAAPPDDAGRLAALDPIVLDADPFACDPHDLQHSQPLRTMVGGERVYRR